MQDFEVNNYTQLKLLIDCLLSETLGITISYSEFYGILPELAYGISIIDYKKNIKSI